MEVSLTGQPLDAHRYTVYSKQLKEWGKISIPLSRGEFIRRHEPLSCNEMGLPKRSHMSRRIPKETCSFPWFLVRTETWPYPFRNVCSKLEFGQDCMNHHLRRVSRFCYLFTSQGKGKSAFFSAWELPFPVTPILGAKQPGGHTMAWGWSCMTKSCLRARASTRPARLDVRTWTAAVQHPLVAPFHWTSLQQLTDGQGRKVVSLLPGEAGLQLWSVLCLWSRLPSLPHPTPLLCLPAGWTWACFFNLQGSVFSFRMENNNKILILFVCWESWWTGRGNTCLAHTCIQKVLPYQ